MVFLHGVFRMALSTQDIGKKIIKVVENQIDAEIEKLDNLSVSELETIRKERLAKMKKDNEEKKVWLENVNYYGTTTTLRFNPNPKRVTLVIFNELARPHCNGIRDSVLID